MGRVIHFEVAADNPERAVKFYTQVFGWKIDKWPGPQDYWLVTTGPDAEPGINGAIMSRQDRKLSTINTVDVASVDEYADKVVKNGGRVTAPRMPVPGIGYFAYCKDTEGNQFGILQPDKSAR